MVQRGCMIVSLNTHRMICVMLFFLHDDISALGRAVDDNNNVIQQSCNPCDMLFGHMSNDSTQ